MSSTQMATSGGGESFAALFEESLKTSDMRVGEVISAEVVRIDFNHVVVNAGLKSEAYIPVEEFKNDQGELEVQVGDFSFRFESLNEYAGPNYQADEARFTIHRGGQQVAELHPQKRFYKVRGMPMTEAGIDPGFTRDLYVSLGEPLDGGAWSVRLHYKAYVRWIWLGALMMATGGLLAASDRRYRLPATVTATAGVTITSMLSKCDAAAAPSCARLRRRRRYSYADS